MTDPDEAPERPEPDRPAAAWCPECLLMIRPKWTDFGIGKTEYWGRVSWHHDWCLACPDCDSTKLEESEPERCECRLCSEVEPVDEMGLCERCAARISHL